MFLEDTASGFSELDDENQIFLRPGKPLARRGFGGGEVTGNPVFLARRTSFGTRRENYELGTRGPAKRTQTTKVGLRMDDQITRANQ